MKKNILEKLALILSVILFLVPKYIAPVCGPKEDGSHMACYFSGNAVMKIAVAIFIITLVMILLSRVKIVKIIGAVATIVLSAYVYLVPHGMSGLQNEMGKPFGVCKIDTMHCHVHHTFEIATGIAVALFFFAFSTIIGWYFFGEANIKYLFGKKAINIYRVLVMISIFIGSTQKVDLVWELADLFNGLMVIPNLIALLLLNKLVLETSDEYDKIHKL